MAVGEVHQVAAGPAAPAPTSSVGPDYKVSINREVLAEIDGPMLKHGLHEVHGRTSTLPARRTDRPDRDLLAWRWERFER